MKYLTTSHRLLLVSSVALLALAYFAFIYFVPTPTAQSATTVNSESVEVGVQEVSPRGEAGGFAVPASGGSYSPTPTPTATLLVRNITTGSDWTASNITIQPSDQVALNWDSSNASSCAGSNFTTGGAYIGNTNTVSEPNPGSSRTYTVSCTGAGGNADDNRVVTVVGYDPVEVIVEQKYVDRNEDIEIEWEIGNNPASECTLEGPGLGGSLSSYTEPHSLTITGESTITLSCPGGVSSIKVHILPTIEET